MKINTKKMKNQNLYRVMSKEDVITSVTETRSGLKTIWSSLHPSFDIEKIIFSDHQINYGDDLDQIYNCNELMDSDGEEIKVFKDEVSTIRFNNEILVVTRSGLVRVV